MIWLFACGGLSLALFIVGGYFASLNYAHGNCYLASITGIIDSSGAGAILPLAACIDACTDMAAEYSLSRLELSLSPFSAG